MTEPEDLEEDLFADLYDGDDAPAKEEPAAEPDFQPETEAPAPALNGSATNDMNTFNAPVEAPIKDEPTYGNGHNDDASHGWNGDQVNGGQPGQYNDAHMEHDLPPIGIKEDGKMFIGGLNWETTDQSLKEYFSTFGEVQECTVMRDGASGRSRGFGFLTFRDPKTVNVVMVKEHYLDGKIVRPDISTSTKAPSRLLKPPGNPSENVNVSSPLPKIDPKRAIPRDEQERTSKIFVGGVSQEANEQIFKSYFAQFGRVVDATLMMDKDTGRPRGFGFVTFDSEAAVDATLAGDLQILGKPIEVKKAQPRGNMREEENESLGRGGPGGGRGGRRGGGRDNDRGYDGNNQQNQGNQNQQGGQGGQGMMGGMTPQMMAQYWQKMQQYFATMQQQMASAAAMQNGGMGGMGAMNPQMMQQMQAMQQMKQMQAMQQQQMAQQGSQSPLPQSPGAQGMAGMNPAMLQQMQQMQQIQAGANGFGGGGPMGGSPNPAAMAAGFQGGPGGPPGRNTPGYNAQEQMAFEQQKYEQQTARRAAMEAQQMQGYQPTSWEGMYDDVPQPPHMGGGGRGGGRGGRGGGGSHTPQPGPQAAPPANAPTGPKNAGKPGANYRGGGRGGGHRGGFHPYTRNG